MSDFEAGPNSLRKLCRALGIDPDTRPVQRVVIDCTVNGVAKVYVQEVGTVAGVEGAAAVLAETEKEVVAVADVFVDERTGDITIRG